MKILDPLSGETIDTDTWDQTNLSIMPNLRETQLRMLARGMYEECRQRPMRSLFFAGIYGPKWNNALGRMIQSDPGDEI